MKKNILMVIAGALMLVACEQPVSQEQLDNAKSSFNRPLHAGVLPDGREVFMVEINMENKEPMFIFFSDDKRDMNTVQETTVQQGRQTRTYNQTQYYSEVK